MGAPAAGHTQVDEEGEAQAAGLHEEHAPHVVVGQRRHGVGVDAARLDQILLGGGVGGRLDQPPGEENELAGVGRANGEEATG